MKPLNKATAGKALTSSVQTVSAQVGRLGRLFRSALLPGPENLRAAAAPAAPGSSPGIESIADVSTPPDPGSVSYQCFDYGPERCSITDLRELERWLQEPRPDYSRVRWIKINGLHPWVVNRLRETFQFHTLAAEDVLRTPQRPKLETHEEYLFIIVRMMRLKEKRLVTEQVSLFLFEDLVLTFQEEAGDVWEPIRRRLEKPGSRIRKQSAAYLLYALLDAVVDHCFPILEQFGDHLEGLEKEVMDRATPASQQQILAAKRDLSVLRRLLWPLRDIANELHSEKNEDIPDDVKAFMRDIYDHTIQAMEILETYREMAGGLNDLYMSVVSNRMNEIMKVLTIMATFFIPITFVAGVYGMNFDFMPELKWKWAYPVLWLVFFLVSGGLLYYFRRKKWL